MTTLYLTTSDQHLITAQKVKIASGDINSVQLCVTFDSLWDNYPERTAVFYTSNDETKIEVLLIDNACVIPSEVLSESCILYVGIRGVSSDGTKVKTTAIVQHKIIPGVGAGATTIAPTMDLYQQYIAAMDNRVDPIFNEIKASLAAQLTDFFEPVVWENPSPEEEFAAQTIEMDLTKCKRFSVLFRNRLIDNNQTCCEFWFSKKGFTFSTHETIGSDMSSNISKRNVLFEDDGVQFFEGMYDGSTNNTRLIPIKITGYKY